MKRKLIVLAVLCLLIAALTVSVSAAAGDGTMPTSQLLEMQNSQTTASEHPYVNVIRDAIREESTIGYMEGFGSLYDVDGNGTLELMLIYPAYVYDYGNYIDGVVYSIYTLSGNEAVPLVEQTELFILAGGPTGSIQVVKVNGKNYIAVHNENYDGGYCGNWVLYAVSGDSISVDTTIKYMDYDAGSDYAIINGVKYNYSKYRSWLNSLNTIVQVDIPAYEGQDDPNALSLSELLSYVKKLPAQTYNGLTLVDGVWGYYIDGVLQTNYTGLVPYGDILFYVENGILDFTYTGLVWHNDAWRYVANSQLTEGYTGLVWFEGNWFYTVDSVIDWTFTGLVPYEGNMFYVQNNRLDWGYTGLAYLNNGWYYVENALLKPDFTGLTYFNDNWFYVVDGTVDWTYTGLAEYNGNSFYVQNNLLDWSYTGLGYVDGGWYYFQNALYTPSFTGLVPFNGSLFYVKNGTIDWSYTGKAEYNGVEYDVKNGVVEL